MPQLNKSEAVRQRLRLFLQRLIDFANNALAGCEALESKINVRWTALEAPRPKLIVKTEIRFLAELTYQSSDPKIKENLKQDLRTLKDFIGCLEDNRDRTQGSSQWHFTLTLWHKSAQQNVAAFEQAWQQRKEKTQNAATRPLNPPPPSPSQPSRPVTDESSPAPPAPLQSQAAGLLPPTQTLRNLPAIGGQPYPAVTLYAERLPQSVPTIQPGLEVSPSHTETSIPQTETFVRHNLPTRDYGTFVGREQPLQQLLAFLEADHSAARISVTGIGGIGKTALVLEAAHRCLDASSSPFSASLPPAFEAVIFASTKSQHFTPHGILPSYRYSRTLQDLFRTIAQTLKHPSLLAGDFEHQLENIYNLLSGQRTLLIIDNLEALQPENRATILSFLYELPSVVKVIVTSRLHLPMDAVIPLTEMSQAESIQFIQHQTQLKAVILSKPERRALAQHTCGTPAAIVYATGQLAVGHQVPQVLPKLTLKTGDYCRYYLEGTVRSLPSQSAYSLLIALSLFPSSASRSALVYIAQLSEATAIESFVNLEQRSLLACQHERYAMLPLTRDYILADSALMDGSLAGSLSGDAPISQELAQKRWLQWYQQWLKPYCHASWQVWRDYTSIDSEWETLQALVEFCINTERYKDFGRLWPGLRGYTYLRGYWNERLSWLEWWLQGARKTGDRLSVMQALSDLGWTLTMMGQPEQLNAAREYFAQAWEHRHSTDMTRQFKLAIEHVVLFLFQEELAQVESWLGTAATLLKQTQEETPTHASLADYDRQQLRLDYYTAQLHYRRENYAVAKALYQDILAKAQQPPQSKQQQQAEVYSLNWLVDIALKEKDLSEADQRLQQSWPIIQGRRDLRSQAFHQYSKAQLEQLRGNLSDSQYWSEQAKACFEALGMHPQVQEMQAWLVETDAVAYASV